MLLLLSPSRMIPVLLILSVVVFVEEVVAIVVVVSSCRSFGFLNIVVVV